MEHYDYDKEVVIEHRDPARYEPVAIYRFINIILDVVEVLLITRFLLRLLAANPGSPFVNFIYSIT